MREFVVEIGEKLHVATRRSFQGAVRRVFIGEVVATYGTVVRLEGWMFVHNPNTNRYDRKFRKHARIVGLSDGLHVITVLPAEIGIEDMTYEMRDSGASITNGSSVHFDADETGPAW